MIKRQEQRLPVVLATVTFALAFAASEVGGDRSRATAFNKFEAINSAKAAAAAAATASAAAAVVAAAKQQQP
eukprot:CAMPEP_0181309072 /NCGR_PEP_ID=MMETSP1101-20121128/11819_1 /TAXON_ID=46948 /ORGANISM="Rhodomonas abbreviata, Strain Caron Lab Isolate" /LENGTH=71 /DNA_ID=CAMNT_0023415533 /DNA_START=18 /DNA_END=229 /DNA_ORIENTATION=+